MIMRMNKKEKRKWLPVTPIGKKALWFSLAVVIWGILMPMIPFPESWRENVIGGIVGGASRVVILIALIILALKYLIKALFKEKDRSILGWICFGFFCFVAGFWTLFIIGEFTFPH
jgi:hypothetical protein